MKLNKYISHSGDATRREAAEWVKAGKITVNGNVELNPAYEVLESDVVKHNSKLLKIQENYVYILMNKPKNVMISKDEVAGRISIFEILKNKVEERVLPVGEMDKDALGLLLITNDKELTGKLANPNYEFKKKYDITLDKDMSAADLATLSAGVSLDEEFIKINKAAFKDDNPGIIEIELNSNKDDIINRIFTHLGYSILRLDRVYYAGLTKKDLPRGWFRNLTEIEIRMLKHFT